MISRILEMLFGKRCDVCGNILSKVAKESSGSSIGQQLASNGYTCSSCAKTYCGKCLPRGEDGCYLFYCDCGGSLEMSLF